MHKIFSCVILISFLFGCFGLFDSGTKRITGKYIVLWIDFPQNQKISEQFEMNSPGSSVLVPEYVFSVGHNEDFIVAKQHPTSGDDSGHKINPKLTNYFIVDMNRKIIKRGEKIFGPLTKNGFDSMRNKLKIQEIKFNINYVDSL